MVQQQLHKTSCNSRASECSKTPDSFVMAKPTASVAPVVHRDSWEPVSNVPLSDLASKAGDTLTDYDSAANGSGTGGANRNGNGNNIRSSTVFQETGIGGLSDPSPSTSSNRTSAVSLLHGNLACTSVNNGEGLVGTNQLNSETEVLDMQKAKAEVVARTRSNSADTAPPLSGVIKVSWPSGDKIGNQVLHSGLIGTNTGTPTTSTTAVSFQQQLQTSKNIIISTISKANNTVVTKVLPSMGVGGSTSKVVLPPGMAARNIGSPPTSILSPRVLVQPSSARLSSASPQLNTSTGCTSHQPKVITVSTSSTGIFFHP